jgi:hypothetical protein
MTVSYVRSCREAPPGTKWVYKIARDDSARSRLSPDSRVSRLAVDPVQQLLA